jgi:LPS O-antigen subunit length determinant protein (WzzB/FepE family)
MKRSSHKGRSDRVDLEKAIGETTQTLKVLDEKVGEITRSIRAYVDYLTEKRVEEELDEFQQRIGRRFSDLEKRIELLEKCLRRRRES